MVPEAGGRVPAEIAGWPTEVSSLCIGGTTVSLVRVAALETHLDRERLLRDDDFEPPYWALVWSGATFLAQWIDREAIGRGRRFLDVGCGLGLVSLTAAKVGAQVTALDRDGAALEFLAHSAALCGVDIERRQMDLVDLPAGDTYDVVAAAELLYERESFVSLVDTMVRVLTASGRLYLADSFRVDTRDFYRALAARGFACEHERSIFVDEEGTRVRVRLACYRRASG